MRMLRKGMWNKRVLLEGKGWVEIVEGGGVGISILQELVSGRRQKPSMEDAYDRITREVVLWCIGMNGLLGQIVEIVGFIGREV